MSGIFSLSLVCLLSSARAGLTTFPTDVETIWISGEAEIVAAAQARPYIHLGQFPELSIVRLDFSDSAFVIELVQKSTDWPEGISFCKEALPATVNAFFNMHAIPIAAVKYLEVVNQATPPLAGCRCYVRLFRRMGFTIINSKVVETDSEMDAFCQTHIRKMGHKLILAVPGSGILDLPEISEIGQSFLTNAVHSSIP